MGKKFQAARAATWTDDQFYLSPIEVKEKIVTRPASERYVIEYLQERQASVGEIMAHASICSPEGARKAIYRLADRGMLRRVNSGSKGTGAIYEINNDGNEQEL